jgi:hypothetical protein
MQRWSIEELTAGRRVLSAAGSRGTFLARTVPNSLKHRQRFLALIKPYHRIMSLSLFVRKLAMCWCVAVAGLSVASAQNITPQGTEYDIIGSLIGDQSHPQVALTPNGDGGYLIWEDNSASTLGLRIMSRRLNAGLGAQGPAVPVSSVGKSKTAGNQGKPQIALLPNNTGAVVVWQGGGAGVKGGLLQIYARFLDANGTPTKSDIRVSSATKNNQTHPQVALLTDGNLVVVWSSDGQDGSLKGIYAQRFSPAGVKIGTEFQVNQFTANNQRTPSVAGLVNGNFVVAWVSELQRGFSSVDVYARLYNAGGSPLGGEFPVNTTTTNLCANPAIASLSSGFAIVWSQKDGTSLTSGNPNNGVPVSGVPTTRSYLNWDIFGRGFDHNGLAASEPVCVNTNRFGDQYGPKISASANGYFVVWTSMGEDGSWEGVFGQALTSTGALQGAEIPVNTTTISRQLHPSVASDGNNQFLTVWTSFGAGTGFDLRAQAYVNTP